MEYIKRTDPYILRAGIFIVSALIALSIGIIVLGGGSNIFSSEKEFFTSFNNVSGLSVGAPVRLGGINVGRVTNIGYSSNPKSTRVQVTFAVRSEFARRIREDSIATIETQGLLGDKYLSISPGTLAIPPAPEGSLLRSKEPADIGEVLGKAQVIIANVSEISESLLASFKGLDKDALKNFSEGAKGFAEISKGLKEGKGLIHRLFYSKKDADKIVGNLVKASESLAELSDEIKNGDGFLHSIIFEKTDKNLFSNLTEAANSLSHAAKFISSLSEEIKSGNGMLHELVYGDSGKIIKDLSKTASNLREASDAIKSVSRSLKNGEGTLGALLVDSKLYDNLVEVTDGAKRSFILKQAIRSSLKK